MSIKYVENLKVENAVEIEQGRKKIEEKCPLRLPQSNLMQLTFY